MKPFKYLLFTFLLVAIHFCGFTQTVKTIDSLEESIQHCLDEGKYMLGCEKRRYFQMNSMLNVMYVKLYASLNEQEKAVLK